jgi:hypothetical protein
MAVTSLRPLKMEVARPFVRFCDAGMVLGPLLGKLRAGMLSVMKSPLCRRFFLGVRARVTLLPFPGMEGVAFGSFLALPARERRW